MSIDPYIRRPIRGLPVLATAVLLAAALSSCGAAAGSAPEKGLVISGPGIRATPPPWPPLYAGLQQRINRLGIPKGTSERFHIHALLRIYNHGLLITVPAKIGLDERKGVHSTIHTHDTTGVIHMEAPHPFKYTLGDFFAIWGVRFGAGTLGPYEDKGTDRVWVYVNGKPISDPARHVLANHDVISIGYGPNNSFPHKPGDQVLREVEEGGALACSGGPHQKKGTPCLVPKARSRHRSGSAR